MGKLAFNKIEPSTQEKMDIVFVGHVDHGKSTVIGRLLADTGSLPEGKLEAIRLDCERNSKPFEYAYLIDALKDERAQSITIDAARVFFKSQRRHYIIIDAPGHIEFIKNMVTGASRAEAAVLVIDAQEGIKENSRRHGYLLWMLGIKQIVVLVNKMDLVGYDQKVFEQIKAEFGTFLNEIGVKPQSYIPVSGREGDGVAFLDKATMPWYRGVTVLDALDSFDKEAPPTERPFRMPVQDVYKFTLFGDDRRIVAGTVATGRLHQGDEVVFYPSGRRSRVKQFETFEAPTPDAVESGQSIGFTMDEQVYTHRGEVVCRTDEPAPQISRRLRASLFWLGQKPMVLKKEYLLKLGSARVRAQIEEIHQVIDASNLADTEKAQIDHHDVAEVTFLLQRAIVFDSPAVSPDLGRFVIVDDYEIRGGGIVLASVEDTQERLRSDVHRREQKWVRSLVNMEQRAERYSQRSTLILITGKKHAGRKTLAGLLEQKLFTDGKLVYYLGVGSVMYGINADLKQDTGHNDWQEHLRRIAELGHIFLDAGLILILTAVELTADDLALLTTVLDTTQVETVWVGDEVTTDLTFDLHVEDSIPFDQAVVMIKSLLKEHGVIFAP